MKSINIMWLVLFSLIFSMPADAKSRGNDALFKKIKKSYTLGQDGSQEMQYYQELTIYTHTSMRAYGQTFVVYNPNYQEVIVNESYTKQVDGTIIRMPANALVDVLPGSAANAPAYNHLLEKVIVHTGLELGATIYLDYTVKTKAGYLPAMDIFEKVKEITPIREYEMTVTVPESVSLNYSSINLNHKPRVMIKDGNKTLTWHLKNLSALSREPEVTIQSGGVEMIAVNTYNPSGIEDTFTNLMDKNDALVKGLLKRILITKSVKSEKEKVDAIHKYVRDNYSLIPLSFKNSGYKVRNMAEVVKSAYGTEVELTQLLYSLLKGEGIDVNIVASYPAKEYKEAFGLGAISEFFVSIGDSDLKSVKGTPLKEKEYKVLKSLTGSDLNITLKISDIDSVFNLKVSQKEAKSIGNDYYLYTISDSKDGIVYDQYLKYNSRRKENLLLPKKIKETYTYEIELKGLRLSSKMKNKNIRNKAGELSISMKKEGNNVFITRKLEIYSQMITPELYPYFKTLVVEWADDNGRKLLMKK